MRIFIACLVTLAFASCSASETDFPAPGTRVYVAFGDGHTAATAGFLESISADWLVLRNDTAKLTTWYPMSGVRLIEVRDLPLPVNQPMR